MTASRDSSKRLRVISWNVNGIRARMPRITELLRRERPDLLCLQETRCPYRNFPHKRLEALSYRAQQIAGDFNVAPSDRDVYEQNWLEDSYQTGLAEHISRCEVKHAYRQGRRPSNHAPLEIELEGLERCDDCMETAIAA